MKWSCPTLNLEQSTDSFSDFSNKTLSWTSKQYKLIDRLHGYTAQPGFIMMAKPLLQLAPNSVGVTINFIEVRSTKGEKHFLQSCNIGKWTKKLFFFGQWSFTFSLLLWHYFYRKDKIMSDCYFQRLGKSSIHAKIARYDSLQISGEIH